MAAQRTARPAWITPGRAVLAWTRIGDCFLGYGAERIPAHSSSGLGPPSPLEKHNQRQEERQTDGNTAEDLEGIDDLRHPPA